MTLDLAKQASRRARLASLLGRLLLSEPGPDVAELVDGIADLVPLGTSDPVHRAAFERLLLREVPPYESVFCGPDGQRGGDVVTQVMATYQRLGFDETDRWRVAGPDHLGLELRCHARLCAEEAAGWRDDRPDLATRAVEEERSLLVTHLGQWGEVAADAIARRAAGGPYGGLAGAVAAFLAEEAARLRPDPDHPGMQAPGASEPPARIGPARLARWLLAPATCGAYLDVDDLAAAALSSRIPWRPSDPRSRLRDVVEEATDNAELGVLLSRLRPAIDRARATHETRELSRDGDRRTWQRWRLQAEATLGLIDRLTAGDPMIGPDPSGPVLVYVDNATTADEIRERLAPLGLPLTVRRLDSSTRPMIAPEPDCATG